LAQAVVSQKKGLFLERYACLEHVKKLQQIQSKVHHFL